MKPMLQLISLCLLLLSLSFKAQAMEWQMLDQMLQAIQQQSYRGEFLHRRGDDTHVYSIVHRYADGQVSELLKQLDGDMIEVFRQNEQVSCFFPDSATHQLDQAIPAAPFSRVDELNLAKIAQNYQAVALGQARVAGYETEVIELRGDQWRFRQRLWLESETKMLLQSEIIAADGHVMEQFRYTRLELGVKLSVADVQPSLVDSGLVVNQPMSKNRAQTADDTGFLSLPSWLPSGFVLTASKKMHEPDMWREQRTYSDGLASFTLFAEQTEPSAGAMAKMGATTAVMTSVGDVSVTLIGEIPVAAAKQIAQALSVSGSSL